MRSSAAGKLGTSRKSSRDVIDSHASVGAARLRRDPSATLPGALTKTSMQLSLEDQMRRLSHMRDAGTCKLPRKREGLASQYQA